LSEEDGKQRDVITVGSLIIKGNTLIYENIAIQINTLTAIWIEDLTQVVKNKLPTWIKKVAYAGGFISFAGVIIQEPIAIAAGLLVASASMARFAKYVPSSKKPKFALGIEKASGDTILFPSGNKAAIDEAANALFNSMSDKEEVFVTVIMNATKKVPVKKSLGSNFPLIKKKKKAAPKSNILNKKPTEKLVENIEKLKPQPDPPPPPPPPAEEKKEEEKKPEKA